MIKGIFVVIVLVVLTYGNQTRHKPVYPFQREQADALFKQRTPTLMLLLGDQDESSGLFEVVSQNSARYPDIMFTYSKVGEEPYSKLIQLIGVHKLKFPLLLYFNSDAEKYLYSYLKYGEANSESLARFITDAQQKKVQLFLRSGESKEDISEEQRVENQKYMTYYTAHSLQQAREKETRDIVLVVYAYWCVYSQQFAPTFRTISKRLQNNKNLVFGKIQGAQNQIKGYEPSGYPLILFWGKDKQKTPQFYYGDRSQKDVMEWIKRKVEHQWVEPIEKQQKAQNSQQL